MSRRIGSAKLVKTAGTVDASGDFTGMLDDGTTISGTVNGKKITGIVDGIKLDGTFSAAHK